jgi:hypothetical protein
LTTTPIRARGAPRLHLVPPDEAATSSGAPRHPQSARDRRRARVRRRSATTALGDGSEGKRRGEADEGERGRVTGRSRGDAWALPLSPPRPCSVGDAGVSPRDRCARARPRRRRHGEEEGDMGCCWTGPAHCALRPSQQWGFSLFLDFTSLPFSVLK